MWPPKLKFWIRQWTRVRITVTARVRVKVTVRVGFSVKFRNLHNYISDK